MNKTFLLLLCFLAQSLAAQTVRFCVVDRADNQPIPYVHVLSESGEIKTVSALDGWVELNNFSFSTLYLTHLSYDNVTLSEVNNGDTVYMHYRTNMLQEVVAVKRKEKDTYVKLKGYYRSYQLNNKTPKYYTDGIVTYYFPLKGNKIKRYISQYRSFRDVELEKKDIVRATTVSMKSVGMPYLEIEDALTYAGKRYALDNENGNITKDGSVVGFVKTSSTGQLQINIDMMAPDKEKSNTLFGYTTRLVQEENTENYITDNIDDLSKIDLESYRNYRKLFYSHKSQSEEEIDCVTEFYVYERGYVHKSEVPNTPTESGALRESCNYTTEFWKEIEGYSVPPLTPAVDNRLGKELTAY